MECYQCTTCLNLAKEYKGTSYYPYIPMSWRFPINKSITIGAYYQRGRSGRLFNSDTPLYNIQHIFPYDDEYDHDVNGHPINISLCTRSESKLYPDNIEYISSSQDLEDQVIIKTSSSVHIDDLLWLIAHKFRHEKQNLFIGGSSVVSELRPDLHIKPKDIDVFVKTSVSSISFYDNVVKSLFTEGDPKIPIRKIDMTRMSDTRSFFEYNDLTITRPVMTFCKSSDSVSVPAVNLVRLRDYLNSNSTSTGEKFILKYHRTITRGDHSYSFFILYIQKDMDDVLKGHIGVRLSQDASTFWKTEKRIQKYIDRGFSKSVTYHDLVDQGSIEDYIDE